MLYLWHGTSMCRHFKIQLAIESGPAPVTADLTTIVDYTYIVYSYKLLINTVKYICMYIYVYMHVCVHVYVSIYKQKRLFLRAIYISIE